MYSTVFLGNYAAEYSFSMLADFKHYKLQQAGIFQEKADKLILIGWITKNFCNLLS